MGAHTGGPGMIRNLAVPVGTFFLLSVWEDLDEDVYGKDTINIIICLGDPTGRLNDVVPGVSASQPVMGI